jgi:hypothetical protein
MRLVVAVCLLAGCAAAHGPQGGGNDLGGSNGICPAHPDQCGGKCCGASCIDITLDHNNCGDCGNVCPSGQVCSGSACSCPAGGSTATICSNGQSCCGTLGCKSLMTDDFHCGDCMTACAGGSHCAGGKCLCGGVQCTGSQTCCSGSCSTTCATPDMAQPPVDMAGGAGGLCMCASHCPLSMFCLGPNCCFEDAFLGNCTPSTTCTPNMMP